MKLVIDTAALQQVTMVVGPVEVPLTREQVVAVLFGEDYEVRRRDDAPEVFALEEPEPRRRLAPMPRQNTRDAVVAYLRRVGSPCTAREVKEGARLPVSLSAVYMSLVGLAKLGTIQRTAEADVARFVFAETVHVEQLTPGAAEPLALPSPGPGKGHRFTKEIVAAYLAKHPGLGRRAIAEALGGSTPTDMKSVDNALQRLVAAKRATRKKTAAGSVYTMKGSN